MFRNVVNILTFFYVYFSQTSSGEKYKKNVIVLRKQFLKIVIICFCYYAVFLNAVHSLNGLLSVYEISAQLKTIFSQILQMLAMLFQTG